MNVSEIQEQLAAAGLDGWLFFDHHHRDPIAYRVLGFETSGHVSRRWYYWIPAQGEPVGLVHRIESARLEALPGKMRRYSGWQEQREQLGALLQGSRRVAMQYSPECMIPYVSLVDGGTVDLVRSLGVEVVSSAALVQYFEARWSAEQLEMHREAGRRVDQTLDGAFNLIRERLSAGTALDEYEVAQFIRRKFDELDLAAPDGPIVAVGPHAGDPHYTPSAAGSTPIRKGDFVLIDLWAKLRRPKAVFYDITWTGFCGETPPEAIQNVFRIVTSARDKTLETIDRAIKAGERVEGWQGDDAARGVIADAGFGDAFVHRTGHSIGEEVHGAGANLDNLETRDERPLIPGVCFSIEPGIYLPEFGVRSEIDCYVSEDGAAATGRVQKEIVRLA